jgi:hypothetical protein
MRYGVANGALPVSKDIRHFTNPRVWFKEAMSLGQEVQKAKPPLKVGSHTVVCLN